MVLCLRGPDLPLVSGRFGELTITAQALTDTVERVWLVEPPVDDAQTTLGPANLRFELSVDDALLADTVERLFA